MPVYNNEDCIKMALNSLKQQEYPNIEIIICDDDSSDRTPEICCQQKDNRIRFYQNEHNLGAPKNHEHVLKLSKGKYFVWASADDSWSCKYISKLTKALQDNPTAGR